MEIPRAKALSDTGNPLQYKGKNKAKEKMSPVECEDCTENKSLDCVILPG